MSTAATRERPKGFFRELKDEWKDDRAGDVAAAVTFFGLLALFPFLLFLVSLASVVIDPGQAESLAQQLNAVAPPQVSDILGQRLRELGNERKVGLLTVGALGALWAASGGMNALRRALNVVYDVRDERPVWRQRGMALAMTLVASVLAVVAAVLMVVTPAVAGRLPGGLGELVRWLRFPVAGLLVLLLFAILYWKLPDVEQRFRFISPGAAVAVVVCLFASWGFSLYVAKLGQLDAKYGALGGIIVLLMWMWVSSQVFLLGAEINVVIEHRSPEGKRPRAKRRTDVGEARAPASA